MHTNSQAMSPTQTSKTGFSAALTGLSPRLRSLRQSWIPWAVIPVAAVVSFLAISGASAPSIPAIALSADPLYASTSGDKPTMALALSVEFPTVGAQYVDVPNTTTDSSYTNTKEYLGYYDAEACYTYQDAPTETPVAPLTSTDYKRFVRSGKAIALTTPNAAQPTWTTRMCWNGTVSYTKDNGTTPAANDAFSGNYLNWASSSAIDMLRLSLTGGDRYVDETSLTILQRAVIPDGNPIHMWNSTNFPGKQVLKSGGGAVGAVAYYGAVPNSMATNAGANDIWVVNTLNRIYFGTAKVGSDSGSASSYTLGGAGAAIQKGTQVFSSSALPVGAVLLGGENVTYNFSGTKEVWFGVNVSGTNYWTVLPASGGIDCYWHGGGGPYGGITDPKGGVAKQCYVVPYTGAWTPTVVAGALNTNGFFYARAEVCNTSSGVLKDSRDFNGHELCTKYPNGNYKPTGAIQKYGDQLRLSAFGYLMDQTVPASGGRYGGVLRAPMKYVGGKTFNTAGVDNTPSGGNPNKEWNETTGIFVVNPDGDATYGKSGVTTYLNQFGRTGSTPGLYKKYDPVGELHYEALRYLQGLQPTPGAVSSITAAMYDGFPANTSWTDPYAGRSNTDSYNSCKAILWLLVTSTPGMATTCQQRMLPTTFLTSTPGAPWCKILKKTWPPAM